MAMTGSQSWHIDAWNVVGGQAFASFREREDEGKKTGRVEGGVFLGAPYFEPEWTGNPSTALAAARAAFQPGFWNDDGAEVSFASIEEVRELVRRAYIAGGGGGMGPDGVVPPEPPPDLEPLIEPPPVEPESLEPWQRQAEDIVRGRPLDRSSREAFGHLVFQMMATTHRSNSGRLRRGGALRPGRPPFPAAGDRRAGARVAGRRGRVVAAAEAAYRRRRLARADPAPSRCPSTTAVAAVRVRRRRRLR